MNIVEKKYYNYCIVPTDIYQHLPTLKKYAEECEHITELGVRSVISTWAFLMGKPKKLVSVDLISPESLGQNLQEVYEAAKDINVDFEFILGDDLEVELEETDLLFIDTYHDYTHLIKELNKL